jgi:uncharacterized Tic20 family protein
LPIICWHIGRNNPWIIHHAKISLNFQMTQTFILLIPRLISSLLILANPLVFGYPGVLDILFLFPAIQLALVFTHVRLAVKASIMAKNNIDETGKLIYPQNHPLTISFLKTPQTSRQLIELTEENLLLITQNKKLSNDADSGVKVILAIPMSLGIWFVCFMASMLLGKGMAGPVIYDYEYEAEGAWRHANDGIGLLVMTIAHLLFWIGLVFSNKYLTQTNIFVALIISLPYLLLFFGSWWVVYYLIFFPHG